jgi:hypothetical protein
MAVLSILALDIKRLNGGGMFWDEKSERKPIWAWSEKKQGKPFKEKVSKSKQVTVADLMAKFRLRDGRSFEKRFRGRAFYDYFAAMLGHEFAINSLSIEDLSRQVEAYIGEWKKNGAIVLPNTLTVVLYEDFAGCTVVEMKREETVEWCE